MVSFEKLFVKSAHFNPEGLILENKGMRAM